MAKCTCEHTTQILQQVGNFSGEAPKRPDIPAEVPCEMANLMQTCWADDPLSRPSFETLDAKFKVLEYVPFSFSAHVWNEHICLYFSNTFFMHVYSVFVQVDVRTCVCIVIKGSSINIFSCKTHISLREKTIRVLTWDSCKQLHMYTWFIFWYCVSLLGGGASERKSQSRVQWLFSVKSSCRHDAFCDPLIALVL